MGFHALPPLIRKALKIPSKALQKLPKTAPTLLHSSAEPVSPNFFYYYYFHGVLRSKSTKFIWVSFVLSEFLVGAEETAGVLCLGAQGCFLASSNGHCHDFLWGVALKGPYNHTPSFAEDDFDQLLHYPEISIEFYWVSLLRGGGGFVCWLKEGWSFACVLGLRRARGKKKDLSHMRRSVTLLEVLLVLALITEAPWAISGSSDCKPSRSRAFRPHSVTITEFGAVGDGTTLNTKAFQNAIFYLRSFADKGGAQLFVPAGRWLTGSFNLISHLTLMLDKEAVILGSIDSRDWPIVDPLPSYGRGRELPGRRHKSLIYGYNLTDVIITGDNGTIDGQGSVWWDSFTNHTLNFTRPHLVELMHLNGVVISNLTFLNSPFWTIHPVYCSQVHIHDITILAPLESPNTDGIDPDSSNDVCIEDCYISTGDDLIAIKSGWDEYGISYARPSTNIFIRRVTGETSSSAGIALGSEMSGGISEVHVEGLQLFNSKSGINIKTSPGRGGYIRNVYISDVTMKNVTIAIRFLGQYGEHPDDHYNASALPIIERITFKNIIGKNIRFAGLLQGIEGDSFHNICLSNITLDVTSDLPWNCSDIQGYSILVSPESCEPLREILPKDSSACYLSNHLPSESSEGSHLVRTMMKFTSMYPVLLW